MQKLIRSTALAVTLFTGSFAGSAAYAEPSQQVYSGLMTSNFESAIRQLDETEMQAIDGRLIMVPWILGIAGLDLALTSVFWGIYGPDYLVRDQHINRNLTGHP